MNYAVYLACNKLPPQNKRHWFVNQIKFAFPFPASYKFREFSRVTWTVHTYYSTVCIYVRITVVCSRSGSSVRSVLAASPEHPKKTPLLCTHAADILWTFCGHFVDIPWTFRVIFNVYEEESWNSSWQKNLLAFCGACTYLLQACVELFT